MNDRSEESVSRYTTPLRIWVLLLAVLVVLGGLTAWLTVEYKQQLTKEAYHDASAELSANASSLKLSIERRILLAESLKAFTDTELAHADQVDEVRFEQFASHFVPTIQGIRNLSIYPDGIETLIYPLKGNEKALGLNVFEHGNPLIRANALRTKETQQITLAGPFELTQGGSGLLTRQSVFKNGSFWGFVSIVIDVPPIIQEAGLLSEMKGIDLALRADDQLLLGDSKTFGNKVLLQKITLAEGTWELAASLKQDKLDSIQEKVRVIPFAGAFSLLLVLYFLYIQLTQGAKLRVRVAERTMELVDANQHIEAANEELIAIEEELRNQNRLLENKEQSLRHMAYHDAITGLHNRTYFNECLEEQLVLAQRKEQSLALLYLDLDQFKLVNDTLGHVFGDRLLHETGQRLTQLKPSGQEPITISRIGGDEFTIIMSNVSRIGDVREMARQIIALFKQPFLLQDEVEHFLTASIGIALYPENGTDALSLIKNADKAMYRAKEEGKNQYKFYDTAIRPDAEETMEIRNSLRRALERDEFEVYYQPQIQVKSGMLIGMEALIRWHHPKRGMISPARFIPIAEETGMIVEIGEWILRKAAIQSKRWQEAGFPAFRMAVNLSARQFGQDDLAESIGQILEETGLEAQYLELEITENMAMKNENLGTLSQLREMGITISIDDFGTQHSSLGYLKRLPVNRIKIDRSFVMGIGEDERDEAIILAMLLVARRLNLSILAEGVETEEQYNFLLNHECDDIQGFLFYRPQPAELIQKVLLDHLKGN